jgi:hypothetical protein
LEEWARATALGAARPWAATPATAAAEAGGGAPELPEGSGYGLQGGWCDQKDDSYNPQGDGYDRQGDGYDQQGGVYDQQGGCCDQNGGADAQQDGCYDRQGGAYDQQSGDYWQQGGDYRQGGGHDGQEGSAAGTGDAGASDPCEDYAGGVPLHHFLQDPLILPGLLLLLHLEHLVYLLDLVDLLDLLHLLCQLQIFPLMHDIAESVPV